MSFILDTFLFFSVKFSSRTRRRIYKVQDWHVSMISAFSERGRGGGGMYNPYPGNSLRIALKFTKLTLPFMINQSLDQPAASPTSTQPTTPPTSTPSTNHTTTKHSIKQPHRQTLNQPAIPPTNTHTTNKHPVNQPLAQTCPTTK